MVLRPIVAESGSINCTPRLLSLYRLFYERDQSCTLAVYAWRSARQGTKDNRPIRAFCILTVEYGSCGRECRYEDPLMLRSVAVSSVEDARWKTGDF